MNLNIKATNTTITPAIKQFIEEKLEVIEKFLKPENKIRVEIEIEKKKTNLPACRAEIDIQPTSFYAESRGVDIYAALDLVVPKIRKQLARNKDKSVSLRRRRKKIK